MTAYTPLPLDYTARLNAFASCNTYDRVLTKIGAPLCPGVCTIGKKTVIDHVSAVVKDNGMLTGWAHVRSGNVKANL